MLGEQCDTTMILKQRQSISNKVYIVKLFLVIAALRLVRSQTFIRNCNDPAIVEHINTFQHTYCAHACRPGLEADGMCAASGNCVCSPPCSNTAAAPPIQPSNDICPPSRGIPPDPDPTFSEANCQASCANECSGGTGLRCEEVTGAIFTPNTLANICTCSCPTVLCGTTGPGPTPTPAPVPGPVTGNSTTVAVPIFKLPLLILKKKKKKIWIILKKIWLFCIIFSKLFAIKSLLLLLYFHIFWDYIDWDLRLLEWIISSVFYSIF